MSELAISMFSSFGRASAETEEGYKKPSADLKHPPTSGPMSTTTRQTYTQNEMISALASLTTDALLLPDRLRHLTRSPLYVRSTHAKVKCPMSIITARPQRAELAHAEANRPAQPVVSM